MDIQRLYYENHDQIQIIYIYIYIYIYFVEHNRHFLSTYFFVVPFMLSYCFYNIRREMVDVSSISICFPSTFYATLGHHQGRIYYKSDVIFCVHYYFVRRASVPLQCVAFTFTITHCNGTEALLLDKVVSGGVPLRK